MTKIEALILAGGQSRRMGGADKALLELGGETLLSRAVRRISAQGLSGAISGPERTMSAEVPNWPFLPDGVPGSAGPLAGVLAGLDWAAARGADGILTVAVDTPFFPENLVEQLSANWTGAIRVAASGGRWHGTFALWPISCAARLRQALEAGERKVMDFATRADAERVDFDAPGFDPFFNVNTPDDLTRARDLLAGQSELR